MISSLTQVGEDHVGALMCRFTKISATKVARVPKETSSEDLSCHPSLENFSQEMPLAGINMKLLILILCCLSSCLGKVGSAGIIPLYFSKIMQEKEHFINFKTCLVLRLDTENT